MQQLLGLRLFFYSYLLFKARKIHCMYFNHVIQCNFRCILCHPNRYLNRTSSRHAHCLALICVVMPSITFHCIVSHCLYCLSLNRIVLNVIVCFVSNLHVFIPLRLPYSHSYFWPVDLTVSALSFMTLLLCRVSYCSPVIATFFSFAYLSPDIYSTGLL